MESAEEDHGRKERKKRMKVTMEYVTPSAGEMAPIVGYFPSGYDLLKDQPEVQVYQHGSRPNRMEVVVRPPNANVEFVGTSYSGEAAAPQLCRYSLAILDKATKTLKIVPIAANKIFRLEPKIKVNDDEEEKVEVLSGDMFKQRYGELTAMYGSKKNKKYAKKIFKMRQQQDDLEAQEFLKTEMQDVEINMAVEADIETVHNLPPYDLTATVPEKAYVLDKIIPKAEWSQLEDLLQILGSQDDVSSNQNLEDMGYPTFVANRIEKLREIKDVEEKRKFARILSYITHLVNFLKLSSDKHQFRSRIRSGIAGEYIPQIIFQRFVSLFVDPASQLISDEKKELCMGYLLVLTLFADDFRTQPHDIAKDIKMTHPSLKPFFQQLGCSFSMEEHRLCCVLEVPLKFPGVVVPRKLPRRR